MIMQSELNKKLFIDIEACLRREMPSPIEVANECEKICLRSQIDLLNNIQQHSDGETAYTLHTYKADIQHQLNQLK